MIEIKGPHRLDHIDYYVRETSPGVYLLSNDGERIAEVGRSDTNVREAILKACYVQRGLDTKYSYFWFGFTPNAKAAFREHCKLWHRYLYMKGVETHPTPPEETNGMGCPMSECEWNTANGLSNDDY
ncbi:MAG: hypothetical protein ACETVX_00265 [bacterium]